MTETSAAVRDRILDTACELFYREGVHAVGVDTVIAQAGVAKSSLYRHFRTKDDLIAAYLHVEDDAFWQQWDAAVASGADGWAALESVLTWIGRKIAASGFRGCPQLNAAAEFPDPDHPARRVAAAHRIELRRRLAALVGELGVADPALVTDQLWLLVEGAFANYDLVAQRKPVRLLTDAAASIVGRAPRRR
jgi:AcrR family transcriptional regulator